MTNPSDDITSERLVGVSIDTATRITYRSGARTWLRRIDDGSVRKVGPYGGMRTMLHVDDVIKWVPAVVDVADRELFCLASAGDLAAASDIGALFYSTGKYDLALDWLSDAAGRGSADAMHWLSIAYAAGKGVEKSNDMALAWLKKAADARHPIALAQLRGLAP